MITDYKLPSAHTKIEEILTENTFYYAERKLRKLYEDQTLHSLVISLIISVILSPERGTLENLYCS